VSGRKGAGREPEFDLAPGEALSDCVGFRVECDGAVVGVVDDVRYDPSTRWDHPTALAIRRPGRATRRLLVPAEQVLDVVRDERLVIVRDPLVVVAADADTARRSLADVEAHLLPPHRRPRRRS
jgi:hypothetical protein